MKIYIPAVLLSLSLAAFTRGIDKSPRMIPELVMIFWYGNGSHPTLIDSTFFGAELQFCLETPKNSSYVTVEAGWICLFWDNGGCRGREVDAIEGFVNHTKFDQVARPNVKCQA